MNAQKDEWEELIRSDLYMYNISLAFLSIPYSNEFLGGPKYRKLFVYIKDDVGRYYENFDDHFKVGRYCLRLFLKDKNILVDYLKFWKNEFDKLNEIIKKIRKSDIKNLSTAHLTALLEQLSKQATYWEGIAYNVDAIDTVLNPLIEKTIERVYSNEKKSILSQIYNKLTFPKVLSYTSRMSLEKLQFFKEMNESGLKKDRINEFIERYYWINFKWGPSKEITAEDIIKEFSRYSIEQIKQEFSELKDRFEHSLKEKQKFVREMADKQPIINDYINIFDEYAVLHDLRKEGQVKFAYYCQNLYEELAIRLKVKKELLYYYWPFELVEILKKNKEIDLKLLNNRSKEFFCEFHNTGKIKEYYGNEAHKMVDKAIGLSYKKQKEISGMGVSQGRVIGKARICLSAKEAIEKISKGDILVTGMTMPDFVPAMKKAAAVVTDEGGLTCHAAIIARELGIPCVVGTKMATRIIKEGNLIEVNANHGIIKIIKRA